MKQAAFIFFTLLLVFCTNIEAQESLTYNPIVSIEREIKPYEGKSRTAKSIFESEKRMLEHNGYVCSFTTVLFTAKVSDELTTEEKSKIKYKWTVFGGEILEGQGTSAITVVAIKSSEMIDVAIEIKSVPKKFSNRKNKAFSSVYISGVCDISTCISIDIISPEIIFDTDKTFTARARLSDPEMAETVIYEWEITNGYIIEGQGTKEIRVVFQGSKDGDKSIVSLQIKDDDLPPECPFTATSIVTLWKKSLPSFNFFNFRNHNLSDRVFACV